MIRKKSYYTHLILLIILLALPALACTTLTGDGDQDEPAVETTGSEPAEAVEPEQEKASESQEQPATTDTDSGEQAAVVDDDAGEQQTAGDSDGDAAAEKTGGDAKENIISALRSGLDVDSMRLHIITEDLSSGLVTEVTLAFVRPDRYQMTSDGAEFIIIEDTTYMNSGGGDWLTIEGTDMTSTVESTLEAFAGANVIEDRQNSLSQRDVNYEGKETINGVDTLVYSFDEGLEGTAISGGIRMWIGEDDGLLYRQEVESKIGDAESRMIMNFEYGAAVTIEPPV